MLHNRERSIVIALLFSGCDCNRSERNKYFLRKGDFLMLGDIILSLVGNKKMKGRKYFSNTFIGVYIIVLKYLRLWVERVSEKEILYGKQSCSWRKENLCLAFAHWLKPWRRGSWWNLSSKKCALNTNRKGYFGLWMGGNIITVRPLLNLGEQPQSIVCSCREGSTLPSYGWILVHITYSLFYSIFHLLCIIE